jgi:hypothetical protein
LQLATTPLARPFSPNKIPGLLVFVKSQEHGGGRKLNVKNGSKVEKTWKNVPKMVSKHQQKIASVIAN